MNEITPTMAKLIELLNEARKRRTAAELEFQRQADNEAEAEHEYRQAHAESMLQSEQKTEGLRLAEAEIATAKLALRKRLSIGLRRSAMEALKGCHDDADTLQAAFHCENRRMKVDLELAGTVT